MTGTMSDWGPVIFATLVPIAVVLLGYLVRISYRQGQLEQKVDELMRYIGRARLLKPGQPTDDET